MKELKNEKLEQVVGGGANSRRIYCPECNHCFGASSTVIKLNDKGEAFCPECNKYVKPVWN